MKYHFQRIVKKVKEFFAGPLLITWQPESQSLMLQTNNW